jgi:hypothetical protein
MDPLISGHSRTPVSATDKGRYRTPDATEERQADNGRVKQDAQATLKGTQQMQDVLKQFSLSDIIVSADG